MRFCAFSAFFCIIMEKAGCSERTAAGCPFVKSRFFLVYGKAGCFEWTEADCPFFYSRFLFSFYFRRASGPIEIYFGRPMFARFIVFYLCVALLICMYNRTDGRLRSDVRFFFSLDLLAKRGGVGVLSAYIRPLCLRCTARPSEERVWRAEARISLNLTFSERSDKCPQAFR